MPPKDCCGSVETRDLFHGDRNEFFETRLHSG